MRIAVAAQIFALLLVGTLSPQVRAQTAQQQLDAEWESILRVADLYAEGGRHRPGSRVFSAIFKEIAVTSYRHRSSFVDGPTAQRWAGDLIRSTLLYATRDLAAQSTYWHGIEDSPLALTCTAGLGTTVRPVISLFDALIDPSLEGIAFRALDRRAEVVAICQGVVKGTRHLDDHLEPWFREFFRRSVNQAMDYGGDSKVALAVDILNSNCMEHDFFLRHAVAPAFQRMDHLLGDLSVFGSLYSQMNASSLRREAIHQALMGAVQEGHITPQEVSRIQHQTTCFRF